MSENLRAVFDEIAPSWYNYRHRTIFRKELEMLAAEWKGGRLLNLGCGHGADFLPFRNSFELHGADFSTGMLRQAIRYTQKFNFVMSPVIADIRRLPYADNAFDYAIGIATYHHLKTEDRLPAFKELKRVLKPGGYAFITVWNRWQPRFWSLKSEHLVPWRTQEKTLERYYNLFSCGDLRRLIEAGGLRVVSIAPESSYRFPLRNFSRNICLLVKKS